MSASRRNLLRRLSKGSTNALLLKVVKPKRSSKSLDSIEIIASVNATRSFDNAAVGFGRPGAERMLSTVVVRHAQQKSLARHAT